jgi:hypothetical protein
VPEVSGDANRPELNAGGELSVGCNPGEAAAACYDRLKSIKAAIFLFNKIDTKCECKL